LPEDNPFGYNYNKELYDEEEEPKKKFFITSKLKQPHQVKEFLLKKLSSDVFNKYCIDCKSKTTTHFVVSMGIFVCMDCATEH